MAFSIGFDEFKAKLAEKLTEEFILDQLDDENVGRFKKASAFHRVMDHLHLDPDDRPEIVLSAIECFERDQRDFFPDPLVDSNPGFPIDSDFTLGELWKAVRNSDWCPPAVAADH